MPTKQRYVLVSILATSVLAGLVMAHTAGWLMGLWGIVDTQLGGVAELSLSRLVGLGAGLAVAGVLAQVPRIRRWLGEVVDELTHVSWPSRGETGHATVVVVVCVVVSSLFLGLFDAAWLWLSNAIMAWGA